MHVVLLSGDLMVVSRVQGAAAKAGGAVRAVSSPAQVIEACSEEQAEMLIVDLSMASLDLHTLASQLKTKVDRSTRIVAFGPHVHEERLEAARAAGCDTVMSRGQFFAQVDALFSG